MVLCRKLMMQGYLQTNGYTTISKQPGVINQGCWPHARRKLDEAIKGQKDKTRVDLYAEQVLTLAGNLLAMGIDFNQLEAWNFPRSVYAIVFIIKMIAMKFIPHYVDDAESTGQ